MAKISKTISARTLTLESQKDVTIISKNFLNIITNSLKLLSFDKTNTFTNNNETPYTLDRENRISF